MTRPVLGSLGLTLVLALILGPARSQPTEKQAASAATLKRPDVSLEIIPDRDGIELGQKLAVTVIVNNNSATHLNNVVVSSHSTAFLQDPAATPTADVAAFGSRQWTVSLAPSRSGEPPAFGPHKVAVIVTYEWMNPTGAPTTSAQTGTISLSLLRRFEEEGKSLPGGTAAFLYLILPLVPAFFAYDAVDRLRRGEALAMPSFGAEQIAPAFLLAFLLSVGFVTIRGFTVEMAYADRLYFVGFLAASAGLGALVPGLRWGYAIIVRQRWGFRNTDTPAAYLRKVLLGPYTPFDLAWTEGTAGGVEWKGMQLRQPDGATVLGARLQVTPESGGVTLQEVRAALADRRRLLAMVDAGKVKILPLEKIVRGQDKLDVLVVTEGLADFQPTSRTSKPLMEAT